MLEVKIESIIRRSTVGEKPAARGGLLISHDKPSEVIDSISEPSPKQEGCVVGWGFFSESRGLGCHIGG